MRTARRLAGIAGFATLVAAGAHAQATAGTESHIVLAHGTPAAGGRALNSLGEQLSTTVGQVATGPEAASPNYVLQSSIAWMPPEVLGNQPIVFGVSPSSSTKDGGKLVRVFGYNFQAPGAGPLNVLFGGQFTAGTFVISNSQATTLTPGEVTALGNPPPSARIVVATAHGLHGTPADGLQPSFLYEPALVAVDHALFGRPLHLHFFSKPGDALVLVLGQTIPGFGVPVPPLEGSAEVIVNPQVAVLLAPLPDGHLAFRIDGPNDPALAGTAISYQGLSLTNLAILDGAFGNAINFIIQ